MVVKVSKILTQNDSYEAAHRCLLQIPEILHRIGECLSERGDEHWEPEDVRFASQVCRLWLHTFRPFMYRDIYLGPSLYRHGDPNRTAERLVSVLQVADCQRHVRSFRVAFTRLTTRSRSTAHDQGPDVEIVADIVKRCTNIQHLYLNYTNPSAFDDVLLPALLCLSQLRTASLLHIPTETNHPAPLLDTYASLFAANPALNSLTLRTIASAITAQHPSIPALIKPPSQLSTVQLHTLVLRDFWITNPELASIISSQPKLKHLVVSRPFHLSEDPMAGIIKGVEQIKDGLLSLSIEAFPIGSALRLLALSLPALKTLTVEEQKLHRGQVIDALPPTIEHLALFRTDFGAAHTSAFVSNLKKYLARGDAHLKTFKVPKWGVQAPTQRTTLFKLGKKYNVQILLE